MISRNLFGMLSLGVLAGMTCPEAWAVEERVGDTPTAVTTVSRDEIDKLPVGTITLDKVLITATRNPETAFQTPASSDVVDAQQLQRRAYRTVPQALRDIPGVMVQETSPGQGSPYIRGFTGRDNLFMIDGVRLNNSTNRSGPMQYWNSVDAQSLDRVEVVKGPGSVLYGSDAVGGTVNAITISPWAYRDTGVGYGARAYLRGSTAERSFQGRGEVTVSYDQTIGFVGGITLKDFGDLQGGRNTGTQNSTNYEEYDADLKGEYFFNPDTRLTILHQRVRQNDVPRSHRYAGASTYAGTTTGSDRRLQYDEERELTYVQFHADNIEESFVQSVTASVSWQVASEVEDRVRSNMARSLRGFDVGTLGFIIQAVSQTPIGKLTYGLDYYRDHVNSFDSSNPIQGSVADDATYDLLGIFIQDQIELAEDLELILGGRFTYAGADANKVDDPSDGMAGVGLISLEDQWTNLSGSARLSYHVVPDHVNVWAGVSQAFRSPNLEDLTSLNIARSGEQAIPSPNLDAETYLAFEAGVKAKDDRLSAEVAWYYTFMFDPLVTMPTGGTSPPPDSFPIVAKTNSGQGFVTGIEAGAAYEIFDHVEIFGNIAWQEGEVNHDYISRVMPLMGQVGVRVESADRKLWGEVQVVMADKAVKLSAGDIGDTQRIPPGGTPGYGVVHLRGGWKVHDNFTLTAAIENVGDEDYRVHGSGSNMPGRNFILTGEVRF